MDGVGYFEEEITAFYLPPEFHLFGIKHVQRWHPIDCLSISKAAAFLMANNWYIDLMKEIVKDIEGLKDLAEDLIAENYDQHHKYFNSVLDDEDMKQDGLWHPETLAARKAKGSLGKSANELNAAYYRRERPQEISDAAKARKARAEQPKAYADLIK